MEFEYNVKEMVDDLKGANEYWTSFLTKDDFELGVMCLDPDQEDIQKPHDKDEVYFIISGDGNLEIEDETFEVSTGKAFYVPRNTDHRFYGNKEPIIAYYALN